MKELYTIRELSSIFKISRKATIRHLRHFNIPFQTKERYTSHIQTSHIKEFNLDLFNSIQLTLEHKVKKPFFIIKDLKSMLNKTHSGAYRWVIRNHIPTSMCGNKTVILASTLRQHSAF